MSDADLYAISEQLDRVGLKIRDGADRSETVVGALDELIYVLNDEEQGHFGTKIVWIGTSLERIADALERLSPPPVSAPTEAAPKE